MKTILDMKQENKQQNNKKKRCKNKGSKRKLADKAEPNGTQMRHWQ